MDILFLVAVSLLTLSIIWITLLALIYVVLDPELTSIQRWGQGIFVLVVPVLGPSIVLSLVNDHSPGVIRRFYIPWPLNRLFVEEPPKRDSFGSNGEEIPGAHGGSHKFGAGDTGGSSD